jgi:hypothetical protein
MIHEFKTAFFVPKELFLKPFLNFFVAQILDHGVNSRIWIMQRIKGEPTDGWQLYSTFN